MRRNRALLIEVLVLFAGAGAGALLFVGNRRDAGPDSLGTQVADAAEAPRGSLSKESELVPDSRTPVSDSDSTAQPSLTEGSVPDALGRLRLRAVDEKTGVAVNKIRARASSATRLADRESDPNSPEFELVLTPDTYAVLVMAKGYEPTELTAVTIAAGRTEVRTSVQLKHGSARIQGTVTGDSWAADALWVELIGEGRSPCPGCAESSSSRCSLCSYSRQSTRLAVPPDGRFDLDRLVSGLYAIRLTDAEERTVCDAKLVELEVAQSRPVELSFSAPRSVLVEVVDVDGTSLAPEWSARLRRVDGAAADRSAELAEPEILDATGVSAVFQCAFRTETRGIGFSTLIPPPPEPGGHSLGTPTPFGSRKLGSGARKSGDDRPRRKGEQLRPAPPEPQISISYFPASVDANGLVQFTSVPSIDLTLVMTSGPFSATIAVPATRDVVRVRAPLVVPEDQKTEGETFRGYEARGWR